MNTKDTIATLANTALLANLAALSAKETAAIVEILLYLAEVEKRKLFLEEGYSSLFAFCTQGSLRYSEPAAMRRITCARAVARFPVLVDELLKKRLSLTTLSLVAAQLTEENVGTMLAAIAGMSRAQVEEYRAALQPKPEAPRELVRPLTVAKPKKGPEPAPLFAAASALSTEEHLSVKPTAAGEGARDAATAEHEQRYELRFTIGANSHAKLQQAKALLLAKYPRGAGVEEVFEEALELLLEKRCPRRRHARRQKRASCKPALVGVPAMSQEQRSRNIPAPVRDEVFVRDEGRCTYISPGGVRCSETADLELHHLKPFAKAGSNHASNLALRCRSHNCHQAVNDYGKQHMAQYLNCA